MKVKIKKSFIIVPNTYNSGEIREFPDELVERFVNAELIERIEEEQKDEIYAYTEQLTVAQLKEELKEYGLSTKGKKVELVERLCEYLKGGC